MFGKVENKILVFRVGISVASCAKIVSIKSGMELTAMVRWHISAIIIISITNDADSSHRSSFSIKSGHQCHGISAFRQPTAITAVYVCKYIVLPFLNNDLLKYCFVVFFSSAAYNMCVCVSLSIYRLDTMRIASYRWRLLRELNRLLWIRVHIFRGPFFFAQLFILSIPFLVPFLQIVPFRLVVQSTKLKAIVCSNQPPILTCFINNKLF